MVSSYSLSNYNLANIYHLSVHGIGEMEEYLHPLLTSAIDGVNGQLHASVALSRWQEPGTDLTGKRVGLRTGQYALEKRYLSCYCRQSNQDPSVVPPVAQSLIPTELSRILPPTYQTEIYYYYTCHYCSHSRCSYCSAVNQLNRFRTCGSCKMSLYLLEYMLLQRQWSYVGVCFHNIALNLCGLFVPFNAKVCVPL